MESIGNKLDGYAHQFDNKSRGLCMSFAKLFEIEELAESALSNNEDDALARLEGHASLALRKESQQFFKVVRCASGYMFFLTLVYFVQSIICIFSLDEKDFRGHMNNAQYGYEIYEYSILIEKLKIFHAITLGSIAFFVLLFTQKFKILNETHYAQLMLAAVLITVVYFIPVAYVAYQAFRLAGEVYYEDDQLAITSESDWETNMKYMADWFFMMLKRSDLGTFGLVVSGLIHIQIYIMLFVMQWCAWHVKVISRKIVLLKEQGSGTYKGVELNMSNAISVEAREESSLLKEDRKPTREEITEKIADKLIDTSGPSVSLDAMLSEQTAAP